MLHYCGHIIILTLHLVRYSVYSLFVCFGKPKLKEVKCCFLNLLSTVTFYFRIHFRWGLSSYLPLELLLILSFFLACWDLSKSKIEPCYSLLYVTLYKRTCYKLWNRQEIAHKALSEIYSNCVSHCRREGDATLNYFKKFKYLKQQNNDKLLNRLDFKLFLLLFHYYPGMFQFLSFPYSSCFNYNFT